MSGRVLLIEFNELSNDLLDRFMGQGLLPNFRRFHAESTIFTTDASEDGHLEPWTQWPTIHTGMPAAEHGVLTLGEGEKIRNLGIGQELSRAGVPVGICGSMNLGYRDVLGYLVPDPWNAVDRPEPTSLDAYFDFVAGAVQDSSRDGGNLMTSAPPFGLFLLRNGLRPGTVRTVVGQLVDERRDPPLRWRRPSTLEHVQYDVFRALNEKYRVRFATFFSNATAHYQHYYWRNMEPDAFTTPAPDNSHPSLSGAVLYGYQSMDRLLGRFLDDYGSERLVLATALSTEAWDTDKCTYRPRDFASFMRLADLSPHEYSIEPVMAEQFYVRARDEAAAEEAEAKLHVLSVDGDDLLSTSREGSRVFVGCAIMTIGADDRKIQMPDGSVERFGDHFRMIHSVRSGKHIPDGTFWVRTGTHRVDERVRSLTSLAPTILDWFDVEVPDYMKGEPLPVS